MGVTLTNEMVQGALQAQQKYGVPASVTLGQIMLESDGSYKGGLSGLAYNYNNLFGIKAGSSWSGDTVTLSTTEYSGGTPYKTTANFRTYNSVAESIDDHGKLLTKSIYTDKTKNATTLEEYVQSMGSVYATDPNYSSKLLNVINTNNLTQYDNGNYSVSGVNSETNSDSGTVVQTGYIQDKLNNVFASIVKILAIVILVVLSAVFFMQAFDLKMPSKKNIAQKALNKVVNDEVKTQDTEKVTIKIKEGAT